MLFLKLRFFCIEKIKNLGSCRRAFIVNIVSILCFSPLLHFLFLLFVSSFSFPFFMFYFEFCCFNIPKVEKFLSSSVLIIFILGGGAVLIHGSSRSFLLLLHVLFLFLFFLLLFPFFVFHLKFRLFGVPKIQEFRPSCGIMIRIFNLDRRRRRRRRFGCAVVVLEHECPFDGWMMTTIRCF